MSKWEAFNNGSGKLMWFVARVTSTGQEYLWGANGNLVRYGSNVTAQRAADKLNNKGGLK